MAWLKEWPRPGMGIVAGILRATCPEILALCTALSELSQLQSLLFTDRNRGTNVLKVPWQLLMLSTAFLGGI